MKLPLLIGGATTSRMHTAVKIAQHYNEGVVHVLDASRCVSVAGSLLSKENKPAFLEAVNKEYEDLRIGFGNRQSSKEYISYKDAIQNKEVIEWSTYTPLKPAKEGLTVIKEFDLATIAEYIDWGPFFIAWEMPGRYPAVLEDEVYGSEARKLKADAEKMLKQIAAEKWFKAKGVIGIWPAASDGADSVTVTTEEGNVQLEFLRQQVKKAKGQANVSLADFIKPASVGSDYMGAFAVSIHGVEEQRKKFEADHDDYNKILVQVLGDRLVEAFAECLHSLVRKEYWGYNKIEQLSNEQLIKEQYQGIRPAPGYPACPDHTEKLKLFSMLHATENTGITLTESLAMNPPAAVCGWYIAHPQSHYFGLGKIQQDQLHSYVARKEMTQEEAEKWLRPVLE